MPPSPQNFRPELETLSRLFHAKLAELGEFAAVSAGELPALYRKLLAHDEHMTETVEAYHGCPVDVRVLARRADEGLYSREILLARQTDGRVVQFGVVRIHFEFLAPHVREEIISEREPLGRILARHNVLRRVQLHELWRVACGVDLARHFGAPVGAETYGRTAIIECNGLPAIELVEIVAPVVE